MTLFLQTQDRVNWQKSNARADTLKVKIRTWGNLSFRKKLELSKVTFGVTLLYCKIKLVRLKGLWISIMIVCCNFWWAICWSWSRMRNIGFMILWLSFKPRCFLKEVTTKRKRRNKARTNNNRDSASRLLWVITNLSKHLSILTIFSPLWRRANLHLTITWVWL